MIVLPLGLSGARALFLLTLLVMIVCVSAFRLVSPQRVHEQFAYDPATFDVWRMLTSEFMHDSVLHLVGNLFFFLAFASPVEGRIGPLAWVLAFLFIAFTENVACHAASLHAAEAIPTIGLSGVVSGFMGLMLCLAPKAEIDCFVLYGFGGRRIDVPLWFFVVGNVAVDIALQRQGGGATVNHVAHIAGFFAGVLARFLLWPLVPFETRSPPRGQQVRR